MFPKVSCLVQVQDPRNRGFLSQADSLGSTKRVGWAGFLC